MPRIVSAEQQAPASKIAINTNNNNNRSSNNNNNDYTATPQQVANSDNNSNNKLKGSCAAPVNATSAALANASMQMQQQQQRRLVSSGSYRYPQQPPPQQLRCYLCETPKQEYSLILSFSEIVCRGCVNYEGPDRVEQLIKSARSSKTGNLATPAVDYYAQIAPPPQPPPQPPPYLPPPDLPQPVAAPASKQSRLGGSHRSPSAAQVYPAPLPAGYLRDTSIAQLSPKRVLPAEKPRDELAPPSKGKAGKSAPSEKAATRSALQSGAQKQMTPDAPKGADTSDLILDHLVAVERKSSPSSASQQLGSSLLQTQVRTTQINTLTTLPLPVSSALAGPLTCQASLAHSCAGRSVHHAANYQTVGSPSSPLNIIHEQQQQQQPSLSGTPAANGTHLAYSGGGMMPLMVRGDSFYSPPDNYELLSARLSQGQPAPPVQQQQQQQPPPQPQHQHQHQHQHQQRHSINDQASGLYHTGGQVSTQEQVAHPYYARTANQNGALFHHPVMHRHATSSPRSQAISAGKPIGDLYHGLGYSVVGPYLPALSHHPHVAASGRSLTCQSASAYCLPGQLHSYPHHLSSAAAAAAAAVATQQHSPSQLEAPPAQAGQQVVGTHRTSATSTLDALLADPRLKNLANERQVAALTAELAILDYQQSIDNSLRRLFDSDADLNHKQTSIINGNTNHNNYQRQHFAEIPLQQPPLAQPAAEACKQKVHHQHQHQHHLHHNHHHQQVDQFNLQQPFVAAATSGNLMSPESPRDPNSHLPVAGKRLLTGDSGDSRIKSGSIESPISINWPETSPPLNKSSAELAGRINSSPIQEISQQVADTASAGAAGNNLKKSYRLSPLSPPPKRPAYAGADDGSPMKSATGCHLNKLNELGKRSTRTLQKQNNIGEPGRDLGESAPSSNYESPGKGALASSGNLTRTAGSLDKDSQQVAGSGCLTQQPLAHANLSSANSAISNHSLRSQHNSSTTCSALSTSFKSSKQPATVAPNGLDQQEPVQTTKGLITTPISPPLKPAAPEMPPNSSTTNNESSTNARNFDSSHKCFTCLEPLDESRHLVQCPSVPVHKFCFGCSKQSIQRQRVKNRDSNPLGNYNDKVFCPSGKKCLLANHRSPWTFMNNEIETIFRETSTRETVSAMQTRLTSHRTKLGYEKTTTTTTTTTTSGHKKTMDNLDGGITTTTSSTANTTNTNNVLPANDRDCSSKQKQQPASIAVAEGQTQNGIKASSANEATC